FLDRMVKLGAVSSAIKGSTSSVQQVDMETNIDFSEVNPVIRYTSEGSADWIKSISYADGKLNIEAEANPTTQPRTATLSLNYFSGWDEPLQQRLYITQMTKDDQMGETVTFEQLRSKATVGSVVTLNDYYIITGRVVSDKNSKNAGENPKPTVRSVDFTGCLKTIYLQSEDGKYGFCVETATEDDNVFERYDRIQLLIKGAKLEYQDDPDRYTLSNVTASMILEQEAGTAADIPVKEKFMSELTDADIYTYVTLKDCEFPFRKGSLTPYHEGYGISGGPNNNSVSKYPRLIRDIQGSSMYIYTNTTCPFRRNGQKLPYGSGKIAGVIVFEYYPQFVYGDGPSPDEMGRLGRYQLRLQAREDIMCSDDDKNTFSEILTEYRYINNITQEPDGIKYWYPTLGENGRMWHSSGYGCYGGMTHNYLGWCGMATGVEPFKNNIGNDGSGLGIILEDGTNWGADNTGINTDGRGYVTANDNWVNVYWWDTTTDQPYAWVVEVSTKGIVTDQLSMQFTTLGLRNNSTYRYSPTFWKAEWSLTNDMDNASSWNLIGKYQTPEFLVWAAEREWQSAGLKPINFPLPLEMLGHDKVYIRLIPESSVANTHIWAGGKLHDLPDQGNQMDYFAIRYNKK
ncbi:MAG: hypothetical protein K2M65_05825, partial [Muribaculaceae bacterium]|nr:hypothetical protein [Muribaculaceae bacterium]